MKLVVVLIDYMLRGFKSHLPHEILRYIVSIKNVIHEIFRKGLYRCLRDVF
jgi:hypothetical protein